MTSNVILGVKSPTEVKTATFDFISQLASGETISSASAAASLWSGTDANPSVIVSGLASVSGTKVLQLITGGLAGNIYTLTCNVVTSAGQTLSMAGLMAITAGTP